MTDAPKLEIDEAYLKRQLADLLAIDSPTGYTDTVVRHVCGVLDSLGVEYDLTRRGAIRARIAGDGSAGARAIVSHLDTLGAQVRNLKPNGRVTLAPIGTWSARFAEGARVTLFTDHGSYRGTILPLKASGHTYNDEIDTQPVGWDHVELRIDAQAFSLADLHELGIEVGDIVAIDPCPEFMESGFIVSRHLDNKAGVAVMLAAIRALTRGQHRPPVDTFWLFTIAEEVGHGAASILLPDIASMVAVDNGTTAPGQNSSEFGVTIAMADQTGPFDYHLTRKMVGLCRARGIPMQKDVFRHYRSDSASAIEAGADVRTALVTFGVDASHGYERIHSHALTSLTELLVAYTLSPVEIPRDLQTVTGLSGFTRQPVEPVALEPVTPPEPDDEPG
ncbi:MAG: osmoprotectant NAGGN system M42 family peptidase [Pararhodobacter sp.]|nr:osmoprotectant NAGGN system M42 family peptidase [Pararhodobacter sp.]